ncbi:hypothetical protein ACOME3_002037 [Neoechinorhynchus agilis]
MDQIGEVQDAVMNVSLDIVEDIPFLLRNIMSFVEVYDSRISELQKQLPPIHMNGTEAATFVDFRISYSEMAAIMKEIMQLQQEKMNAISEWHRRLYIVSSTMDPALKRNQMSELHEMTSKREIMATLKKLREAAKCGTRRRSETSKYCICKLPKPTVEMVLCESGFCESEWFHLDCLRLEPKDLPDMEWYCESCLKDERLDKNAKKRYDESMAKKKSAW